MMSCFNIAYPKWHIGNDVRAILLADANVSALVGSKIFPCVAPENTDGIFIVYSRDKYSKSLSKSGFYQDECHLAISIVSDNYDDGIDLAEAVDEALTGEHTIGENKIDMSLADSTETYDDFKYIETLLFSIK